jgi:copper(I)-binding protein
MKVLPLALAVAAAAGAAHAEIRVTEGWSRPAGAGFTGVGYLTIANTDRAPVALIGVESPVAARAEVHRTTVTNGVSRMSAEPRVVIPAGGRVVFQPNGRHLMLIGLKQPLNVGGRVPVTLRFEGGRSATGQLEVRAGAAPARGRH